MTSKDTLTQAEEPTASVQAVIPESAHRHYRKLGIELGLNNSDLLVYLLKTYTGYVPPEPASV